MTHFFLSPYLKAGMLCSGETAVARQRLANTFMRQRIHRKQEKNVGHYCMLSRVCGERETGD
jgi:hypothetical protein